MCALLLDEVPRHPVRGFQPQELSNIVWAMGTLGTLRKATIDHLLAGAAAHMDAFIPQALSNMVWACAHLRNGTRGCLVAGTAASAAVPADKGVRPGWQPSPAFLEAVAAASTRLMPDFQSQVGCARCRTGRRRWRHPCMWMRGAVALQKHRSVPPFCKGLLPLAYHTTYPSPPPAPGTCPLPQSMSNLLWGFCKLDVYPQDLFEAAAAELVER